MHFWIDKRSTQCSYSGRHRVPTSLSAGVGRSRGRVGVGVGRKGAVTPLHRLQPVDCVPRRSHHARTHRYYGPPPLPLPPLPPLALPLAPASARRHSERVYVELAAPPTLRSLAAQRSVTPDTLLRAAALGLHRPPLAPHLKCGMWASFALAVIFVAGAKFYFDHQMMRDNNEAAALCAAVGALAAMGCLLTRCRSKPAPLTTPDRVSSTAHRPPISPTREPSDDLSLGTLLQSVSSSPPAPAAPAPPAAPGEAPPPPYHIAVLLPARDCAPPSPDPPPPSYSALS